MALVVTRSSADIYFAFYHDGQVRISPVQTVKMTYVQSPFKSCNNVSLLKNLQSFTPWLLDTIKLWRALRYAQARPASNEHLHSSVVNSKKAGTYDECLLRASQLAENLIPFSTSMDPMDQRTEQALRDAVCDELSFPHYKSGTLALTCGPHPDRSNECSICLEPILPKQATITHAHNLAPLTDMVQHFVDPSRSIAGCNNAFHGACWATYQRSHEGILRCCVCRAYLDYEHLVDPPRFEDLDGSEAEEYLSEVTRLVTGYEMDRELARCLGILIASEPSHVVLRFVEAYELESCKFERLIMHAERAIRSGRLLDLDCYFPHDSRAPFVL